MSLFEQKLLKQIDKCKIKGVRLLVAVSGGRDSVALLHALNAIAKRRGISLTIAHIHHGVGPNKKYRDEAAVFVKNLAKKLSIQFFSIENYNNELNSEAELRSFRRKSLLDILNKTNSQYLVLAHHADDLLETRLLRLMRGVGAQGFGAMAVLKEQIFRPFLCCRLTEIVEYAAERNLDWMEDPTNKDSSVLRNWIRNIWLPIAEKKRPGTRLRLMKSFEYLAESLNSKDLDSLDMTFDETGIFRLKFLSLPRQEQRRVVASYMLSKGLSNYGATHVEEVVKRLDTQKKEFNFNLLKRKWLVDTERIRVEESL